MSQLSPVFWPSFSFDNLNNFPLFIPRHPSFQSQTCLKIPVSVSDLAAIWFCWFFLKQIWRKTVWNPPFLLICDLHMAGHRAILVRKPIMLNQVKDGNTYLTFWTWMNEWINKIKHTLFDLKETMSIVTKFPFWIVSKV